MTDNTESQLRAEIENLKQKLAQQQPAHSHGHTHKRPATGTLILIAFVLVLIVVGAFFGGYLPHMKRQTELVAEAKTEGDTAPLVNRCV